MLPSGATIRLITHRESIHVFGTSVAFATPISSGACCCIRRHDTHHACRIWRAWLLWLDLVVLLSCVGLPTCARPAKISGVVCAETISYVDDIVSSTGEHINHHRFHPDDASDSSTGTPRATRATRIGAIYIGCSWYCHGSTDHKCMASQHIDHSVAESNLFEWPWGCTSWLIRQVFLL